MGGEITAPGAEERKMRLAEAHSLLDELGFEQYSIFHFGMNSSRHLYGLWQMRDREWLGLGVGAVSHVFGAVFSNVRDIREYMRRAKSGMDCVESGRVLTARERMRRTLVFGMRLRDFELHWFSEPECDDCIASQICGGPCSLELIFRDNRLNPDRCAFFKAMVEWVITR